MQSCSGSTNINTNYSGDVSPTKAVSPCDEAYDQLVREQDIQRNLVGELSMRLEAVLRSVPPQADGGQKNLAECPQSEIHGRFMGAATRVHNENVALKDLLERLTV